MVRVTGLAFAYPDGPFRLRVRALEVAGGERVALVGPSGCGKTTLLHLVCGIERPAAGSVVTCGVEVSALDDRARRDFRIRNVGLVFQGFELLDYLDVEDNILLPYRVHPALRLDAAVRARARGLAEGVGIGALLRRAVDRLSFGERQRVAICRALVAAPRVVLADEPTGNLDPDTKGQVLDTLFRQAGDATVVVATHDHGLLPRFGRVVDLTELAG